MRLARALSVFVLVCASCDGGGEPRSDDTSSASSSIGSTGSTGGSHAGSGGGGGMNVGAGGMGGGGGATTTVNCDPPEGEIPQLGLELLLDNFAGLYGPVLLTPAPGDLTRLFIVDLGGRIRILKDSVLSPEPFLDIESEVEVSGERGLLGLAFHPDYEKNGRFFVHFSQLGTGNTEVAEFVRGADEDHANPQKVQTVLTQMQPNVNHKGGSIEFGPDGLLYVFLGDGGSGASANAQDLTTRLGKILRVDVDRASPFVPAGGYPGALPEVWTVGMRNPWRASFDPCTGDLYIGDVGQYAWEEIDVLRYESVGLNLGWNIAEGNHCYAAPDCDLSNFVDPVHEYPHVPREFGGGGSIIGGYVYRGSAIPAMRGRYLFADLIRGEVFSLRYDGGSAMDVQDHTAELAATTMIGFGQDPDGEVYLLTFSSVFKIVEM